MDSSIPPPPSVDYRKLRPWYLVPAMVLSWSIGVRGLLEGFSNVVFLHEGRLPDVATVMSRARETGEMADFLALINAVQLESMYRLYRFTFPLGIALALLSALLVISSGMAMGGRPGTRSLCLQALFASAALAVVSYVLTRPVRVAWIDTVVQVAQGLAPGMRQREILVNHEALWWGERFRLIAFELGSLGLAALALTRERTKTFFEAIERATESAEDS